MSAKPEAAGIFQLRAKILSSLSGAVLEPALPPEEEDE